MATVGPNRSITNALQRERENAQGLKPLNKDELEAVKQFKAACDEMRIPDAIRIRQQLEKAYKKQRLEADLEAYYREILKTEQQLKANYKEKEQLIGNVAVEADKKRGGESPMERLASLARFDQTAMAFLMAINAASEIISMLWIATGAQLALGNDFATFEHLKEKKPHLVFDPADYPYPQGNSVEAIQLREQTEKRLLERQIFDFEVAPNNQSFELVGKPITDPRLITPEICVANKIMPMPSVILQLRQEAIRYNVSMVGASGDVLYVLDKHSDYAPKGPSQGHGMSEAEKQQILQSQRRPSS